MGHPSIGRGDRAVKARSFHPSLATGKRVCSEARPGPPNQHSSAPFHLSTLCFGGAGKIFAARDKAHGHVHIRNYDGRFIAMEKESSSCKGKRYDGEGINALFDLRKP
jgi:hypothetical protein